MDEQRLMERARAGDAQAFEQLITPLEEMVWRVCYRILGQQEDAQDAAQDAMLKAYRSLSSFRGDSSFKTWMYHIASSCAMDMMRKKSVRPSESLDALQEAAFDPKDPNPLPEESAIRHDRDAQIRLALSELSETLRVPLMLYAMEGMPYEQIAQQTGLPLGTIKSRINRARQSMADRLQDFRDTGEQRASGRVQNHGRR